MYLASASYLMVCQLSLWSFYSCTYKCLTLEMSFRRNFNSAKEEPHKAPASVWFSSIAFLFGFCVSENFFLRVSKKVQDICKNVNLENTFKAETFPSRLGLQMPLPSSRNPHMHTLVVAGQSQGATGQAWSQQPLLGPWLAVGLSPHPARGWAALCRCRHCSHEIFMTDLRS